MSRGPQWLPKGSIPAIFAIGLGLLSILLALAALFDDIDWGTAGEWAAALVTAPVLVVAIVALASERKHTQMGLQQERDLWADELKERERSQASQVGCYYVSWGDGYVDVLCRNNSDVLIYDVRPCAIANGRDRRGPSVRLIGGKVSPQPPGGTRLGPKEEMTFRLELPPLAAAEVFNLVLVPNGYGVTFADNAGRWWRKWGDLTLEPNDEAKNAGYDHDPSTPKSRELAGPDSPE
jgi:hypothetical protein